MTLYYIFLLHIFIILINVSCIDLNNTLYPITYDCNKQWPDLELFLPIACKPKNKHRQGEWHEVFLKSYSLFWPFNRTKTKLTFMIDLELMNTSEYQLFLNTLDNKIIDYQLDKRVISIVNNSIPSKYWNDKGHSRQQMLMMLADTYTTSEYIGLIDTDCKFITYVDYEDLFINGKPVVQGIIGPPQNLYWYAIPISTYWLFQGYEEPMRCMSYFPVIIKASHLKDMRDFLEKLHNKPFNEIFQQYSKDGPYSQFNAMCAYIWYFKREEYEFVILDRDPNWPMKFPENPIGSITNRTEFTTEMLHPKPRIAIHTRYHDDRFSDDEAFLNGYCRSPPFPKVDYKSNRLCSNYTTTEYYSDMHSFENMEFFLNISVDLLRHEATKRYNRLINCSHDWNFKLANNLIDYLYDVKFNN